MEVINTWEDYELIDAGGAEKLERWGLFILRRPDPQAIWPKNSELAQEWETASAVYTRSSTGGGEWKMRKKLPTQWVINYQDLKFFVRPTGFKHTGIFPEQAGNWEFLRNNIKKFAKFRNKPISVLNLFGYTGCATVACSSVGASVVHIDSSKQILTTAKDNIALSGLSDNNVRYIPEDAISFVKKELRRGNSYDIIIMDPPTFGRGDKGQVWKIEKDLSDFIDLTYNLLSSDPIAFLVNTYVSGLSSQTLKNMLNLKFDNNMNGVVEADELGLPIKTSKPNKFEMILPTGVYARWHKS